MRKKLIELLGANTCKHDCCEDCEYCEDRDACIAYLKNSMADHLIDHGVTVQEWISVKDRLPESGECALVFNAKDDYFGLCEFSGVLWYDSMYSARGIDEVTHWMPLPPAPKGE